MTTVKCPTTAASDAVRYVAFLRGINVGGHRLIKMDELARISDGAGVRDVRTVIASGNVLSTSDETDVAALTRSIERALVGALGYEVTVFLQTVAQLQELVRRDPLVDMRMQKPGAKCYVALHEADLRLVVEKLPTGPRYGDPTAYLARTFSKTSTTTRNWNTVGKIAGL